MNVPVVSAIQTAINATDQVGKSKNDRVNAMAAANAGFDAYKAGQSLAQLKDAAAGVQNLAQAANFSVSITYGEQKDTSFSHTESTSFSPTFPQQDKGKDSSTTYATLTDGNINIRGKETTVEELGIHSAINTAIQRVDEVPDLQAILEKQKIVSDATSTIVATTRTYSQNKQVEAEAQKQAAEQQAIEKLKAEGREKWEEYNSTDNYAKQQDILKESSKEYKAATEQAQAWSMGGDSSRALNAVIIAI